MASVPEMMMGNIPALTGCVSLCLSSEPQRYTTNWAVQSNTECTLTGVFSGKVIKNEIASPLVSDSTLIQLRENNRLYW